MPKPAQPDKKEDKSSKEDEKNKEDDNDQQEEIDINAPDNMGITPLLWAVMHRHADCTKYLIEKGTDVNCTGAKGDTPVHYACKQGDEEILKGTRCDMSHSATVIFGTNYVRVGIPSFTGIAELVDGGADIETTDDAGNTPLHGYVLK